MKRGTKARRHEGTKPRQFRAGFSFAEVMFAVIVLGIGFIMVAAIFPVAIQQTRLTAEETTAAVVAREATSVLEQLAAGSDKTIEFPVGSGMYRPLFEFTQDNPSEPPRVYSVRNWPGPAQQPDSKMLLNGDELWRRLRGSLIPTTDPRFAWTVLYSRAIDSPFIRVYIFVLHQQNGPVFTTSDLAHPSNPNAAVNLQPRLINVFVYGAPPGSGLPDTVEFAAGDADFAAEGAYIVLAGQATVTPTPSPGEVHTGLIYRLGASRGQLPGGSFIYEVDPAYDVPDGVTIGADAWIVGRGVALNAAGVMVPQGPAMDVALYVTFVKVN